MFIHKSAIHGQAHVARTLVHAFRLIDATGHADEAPRLWAAVYLHDLSRTHDGRCYRHGTHAAQRLATLADVQALFIRGGVTREDFPAIETAVVHHCLPTELDPRHPHHRLTTLLKDADALDRVRLGDLNPHLLRHDKAREMIPFAQTLFEETDGVLLPGADYFPTLWKIAVRLAKNGVGGAG
jgi:hypothetical protein